MLNLLLRWFWSLLLEECVSLMTVRGRAGKCAPVWGACVSCLVWKTFSFSSCDFPSYGPYYYYVAYYDRYYGCCWGPGAGSINVQVMCVCDTFICITYLHTEKTTLGVLWWGFSFILSNFLLLYFLVFFLEYFTRKGVLDDLLPLEYLFYTQIGS